jgi:apolipoprotein D and lipocalin family protein
MDEVTADYALHETAASRWSIAGGAAKPMEAGSKASEGPCGRYGQPCEVEGLLLRPFYGDYWILDHGEDYDWSIVGEPSDAILGADRVLHPAGDMSLSFLEERVKALGYDWSLVRKPGNSWLHRPTKAS